MIYSKFESKYIASINIRLLERPLTGQRSRVECHNKPGKFQDKRLLALLDPEDEDENAPGAVGGVAIL